MAKELGEITWQRGDDYPFTISVKANGQPVDFTGYLSITLCLNSIAAPTDISTELFKAVGVFGADRTRGKATFSFTPQQADNLGSYYYDIQAVDALGKKRTYPIENNTFIFVQDINKD